MVALLFYHIWKVNNEGMRHGLALQFRNVLPKFALFIPPPNMDIKESKFGKVLVRHIRHYKLLDNRNHRNQLLDLFWHELVKELLVTSQGDAQSDPTFDGSEKHFKIDKHKMFLLKSTEEIPPLSVEFKTYIKQITINEENKRLVEIKEQQNKFLQGLKDKIVDAVNFSTDKLRKIEEIHARLIKDEASYHKWNLNLEKINALMSKIKDEFEFGDRPPAPGPRPLAPGPQPPVIEVSSGGRSAIDRSSSGGRIDSSDGIIVEYPPKISRQKLHERTCGYHALQNLLLQVSHKTVFTRVQLNTICNSSQIQECTIPAMIYLLGGNVAALPDCLLEIKMKNIEQIRKKFSNDFEAIEIRKKENPIKTEKYVTESVQSLETCGFILLIQKHYFALVKIGNEIYKRVDSLPNVTVEHYKADGVVNMIMAEIKSNPEIFSFGIQLKMKKGKIDNLPPRGSLVQILEQETNSRETSENKQPIW
jgi:hypothetical protein